MELRNFNPWWRDGKVPAGLLGRKRRIFNDIIKYVDKRQIILFTGLRRVGKTTLMYQIMDELLNRYDDSFEVSRYHHVVKNSPILPSPIPGGKGEVITTKKGVSPYDILYFSFDEMRYDLGEIVKEYEMQVLRGDISKNRVFIFLDEIQKLPDWTSKVKLLYDMNPGVKIFLTGSAQITMWKGIRESLAGRFFDFEVNPLDFDEYLEFKGITVDRKREGLFEKDLKLHMDGYLKTGGFIEALELDDHMLRKYLKESLLERVVFVDIPQTFRLDIPELLFKILTITAARPGFYLDYKSLGNDLKIDHRTISNYVSYLEYVLFLQKLYNYSRNLLTSEKKVKRLYLCNTAFTLALNPQAEFSLVLEQFFVNTLDARFFLKTPQKEEIDIIHTHNTHPMPVEVKIREKVGRDDVKTLFRFMEKNNINEGLIITLDTETTFKKDRLTVEAIPYWKHWSILRALS